MREDLRIKGMERIRKIFRHPLYSEHLHKLMEAETDREYCRHDISHFLDVARISYIYALEDGAGLQKEIIYAAALLHDIGRYTEISEGIPHETAGAELSEIILGDCGFAEADIAEIKNAISRHRKGGSGLLAEYIYRADKQSRRCFECNAAASCKWSEEKKNHDILI